MHLAWGRTLSRYCLVLVAGIGCASEAFANPPVAESGKSASHRFDDHATGQQVLDFYESKGARNLLTPALLARATAADTLPLKQALASIDRDKKRFRFAIEDGQLRVSNLQGQTLVEVSSGGSFDGSDKRGDFLLNGRPFSKPTTGSVFDAIRRHLARPGDAPEKNAARPFRLLFPKADANETAQMALPVYLYIDFQDARQTPPQSHSVSQEVQNQAAAIKTQVMPESSNAIFTIAKRFALDEKGALTCEGSGKGVKAKGVARIDGQMHRFESRADGDVILTPAFREGPPVRLRPSRVDFDATAKQLDSLIKEFAQTRSSEAARTIIDGPVRTICERITMLKVEPKIASLCESAYENKVSIEGRCLHAERGPARVECERSGGISLSQNSYFQFQEQAAKFVTQEAAALQEMAQSVANVKVIGRRLSIGQCQDGMACNTIGDTNAVEMIRPAPPKPSSEVAAVLAKRHPAAGNQPLVQYGCRLQNETCSLLVETEAARQLPSKEQGKLRVEIRKANQTLYWRKDAFLSEASALRPLGQCCAEKLCREQLQKALGLNVKSSDVDSSVKGTAK